MLLPDFRFSMLFDEITPYSILCQNIQHKLIFDTQKSNSIYSKKMKNNKPSGN